MRRTRLLLPVVCAALLAVPVSGGAESYTWTDDEGRVHFTDDLGQVPPPKRFRAKYGVGSSPDDLPPERSPNWSRFESAQPAAGARARAAPAGPSVGQRYEIPVAKAGLEMMVRAQLPNGVRANFIVDTGAMMNTIPRPVVEALGIRIDAGTPRTSLVGVGGRVQTVPVVSVRSLSVGGATVENVEMAVLDTLPYGLLGMPFFNHFKVETDPARGLLTLEQIDLEAVEGIYGGYGERYWRSQFRRIRSKLDELDAAGGDIPSHYTGLLRQLEQARTYWRAQYEDLQARAARAGVPQGWRE